MGTAKKNDTLPLSVFRPPYTSLDCLPKAGRRGSPTNQEKGVAIIWQMTGRNDPETIDFIRSRPGGLTLIAILPEAAELDAARDDILEALEEAAPHGLLPYHPRPKPEEIRTLLKTFPTDLGEEVADYAAWRGLKLDPETRELITKIGQKASTTKTLRGLCKKVYLSRRALGRRFHQRGLPVPSHWLQFFRLIHSLGLLQAGEDNAQTVARKMGYPDGFTLSNQMNRLIGVRPSLAKNRLGWEWFVEAWLQQEWKTGGLNVFLPGFPQRREVVSEDA